MINVDKMLDTPLKAFENILNRVTTPDNLPEYTKMTRLTPICNMSRSASMLPSDLKSNVLQTALAIYCTHYLQAFKLMSASVKADTLNIIEQLSDSNSITSDIRAAALGKASSTLAAGLEAEKTLPVFVSMEADASTRDLQDPVNLGVGRVMNVSVKPENGNGITIPVTAQLLPRIIDDREFAAAAGASARRTGYVERYHQWRAGEIESFSDYIFGLDLVRKDMENRLKDDSGMYSSASDKKHPDWVSEAIREGKTRNRISMMSVITMGEMEAINQAVRGNILKRERDRAEYFFNTAQTLVMAIDNNREMVYLLQRGVSEVAALTYDDIRKAGTKKDGIDMNALVRDLVTGTAGL